MSNLPTGPSYKTLDELSALATRLERMTSGGTAHSTLHAVGAMGNVGALRGALGRMKLGSTDALNFDSHQVELESLRSRFRVISDSSRQMISDLGAIAGVARPFINDPNAQTAKDVVLRVAQLEKLRAGALPTQFHGALGTNTAGLLQDFVSNVRKMGFSAELGMSQEGAVRMSLSHHNLGDISEELPVQIGEMLPLRGKVSIAKMAGIELPVLTPGTSFNPNEVNTTRHRVAKRIAIVNVSSGKTELGPIRSWSDVYLEQVQDILKQHTGIRGDSKGAERSIRALTREMMEYATFSSPSPIVNMAKAHDVMLLTKDSRGRLVRYIPDKLKDMSSYLFKDEGWKKDNPFGPYAKGMNEVAALGQTHGLGFTALKPELFMAGTLSSIIPADVLPFSRYADPARQIYQALGRGQLAGGRFLNKMKGVLGGRVSVPWFSTSFMHGAERGMPSQVQARVAFVNDTRFLLPKLSGTPFRGPAFDSSSGGLWISSRLAEALTRDITSQLDVTNPRHQPLLTYMHRKKSIFTVEGQQVLERSGIGSSIMIGDRLKGTISGVYAHSRLEKYSRGRYAVPDVIVANANLAKYPELARSFVLGSAMQAASDRLAPTQLNKLVTRAARIMRGEARWSTDPTSKALLPTFVSTRPGQSLKLGRPQLVALDRLFRKHGLNFSASELEQTRTIMPSGGVPSGAPGTYSAHMGVAGVSLRTDSQHLMTKISPIPVGSDRLQLDSSQGFKLQMRSMRMLEATEDVPRELIEELRSVYEDPGVKKHGQQLYMAGASILGRTPTEATLSKEGLDIPTYTVEQLRRLFLETITTDSPERLRAGGSTSGTYFADDLQQKLSKGFMLTLDQPVVGKGPVGKFERRAMYFAGPALHAAQVQAEVGLSQYGRAEESAIRAITRQQGGHYVQESINQYAKSFLKAAGGKDRLFDSQWLQPRIGGSAYGLLAEASVYSEGMSKYGRGVIAISPEFAKELGIDKIAIQDSPGGQRYAYGLMHSDPAQGPGNIQPAKYIIDEALKGTGSRAFIADPLLYRPGLRDTDQDRVSHLFAYTAKMSKAVAAWHAKRFGPGSMNEAGLWLSLEEMTSVLEGNSKKLAKSMNLMELVKAEKAADPAGQYSKAHEMYRKVDEFYNAVNKQAAATDLDFLEGHSLRYIGTKLKAGSINVGNEIIRYWMQGDEDMWEKFGKNYPNVVKTLTHGDPQKAFLTNVLHVQQTSENLEGIKKAYDTRAGLVAALSTAMTEPFTEAEIMTGASPRYTKYAKVVETAVLNVHEEVFTSKQGVALEFMSDIRQRADNIPITYDMFHGKQAGYENLVQPIEREQMRAVVGWMTMAMRRAGKAGVKPGQHVSAVSHFIRNQWEAASHEVHLKDLEDLIRDIEVAETVQKGGIQASATVQRYAAVQGAAAAIHGQVALETHAHAVDRAAAGSLESVGDDGLGRRVPSIDKMVGRMMDWWDATGPGKRWGWRLGLGAVALAGVKNSLFPDVVGEFPRKPDYKLHNPPYFGYLTAGSGYTPTAPLLGDDLGPTELIAPSFGPGLENISPQVLFGPGRSQEGPPPVMMSGPGIVPPPMPEGQGAGMPEPMPNMPGPRAVVSNPPWMRMSGGIEAPSAHGVDFSESFVGNQGGARGFGMDLGSMIGTPVEVTVSDDSYSRSDLEIRHVMREQSRGRIYRGSSDIA